MAADTAPAQGRPRSVQPGDRTAGAHGAWGADGVSCLAFRHPEKLKGARRPKPPGALVPSKSTCLVLGSSSAALDRDFLHRPGRAIAFVDHVLRLAVDRVDQAAVLAMALGGLGPAK